MAAIYNFDTWSVINLFRCLGKTKALLILNYWYLEDNLLLIKFKQKFDKCHEKGEFDNLIAELKQNQDSTRLKEKKISISVYKLLVVITNFMSFLSRSSYTSF